MSRWAGRAFVALALACTVVAATGYALAHHRSTRVVVLPELRTVTLPQDDASLAHGAYLYATRSCGQCHGEDAAGLLYTNEGGLRLAGPGIRPGPGSATAAYTAGDWVRTLRHGVKPDGRPLMVMPSQDFNQLHDADIAALAAYVSHLPPLQARAAVVELPWWLTLYYGFGGVKDAAAEIDHGAAPRATVAVAVTVAQGRYLATMCTSCHGRTLEGGPISGAPDGWPHAPNLRAAAGPMLQQHTELQSFTRMMRTGRTAGGRELAAMPAQTYRLLSDVDLQALHLYLVSAAQAGHVDPP